MAVLTCGIGGTKDFFEHGATGHYNARYGGEHFALGKAGKRLLSAYQVALGARN